MAQRITRRRHLGGRPAARWIPDELVAKVADAVGDPTLRATARTSGTAWSEALAAIADAHGGVVPPGELQEGLDELVARLGVARATTSVLLAGPPVPVALPAIQRLLAAEIPPLPPRACSDPAVAAADVERLRREVERLQAELARTVEKAAEKDRKLREERAAHAETRSALTSERDRARNEAAGLAARVAAAPDGALLAESQAGLEEARARATAAEEEAAGLRAALDQSEQRATDAEGRAATARAEAESARSAAAAAAAATPEPTPALLVSVARALGQDAAGRVMAPSPGDPELLEALAALARWTVASSGAPPAAESRPTAMAVLAAAALEPRFEPDIAAPLAPARLVRADRPARITVLGGGSIGASAYLIEHLGRRLLLDCGIDSHQRPAPVPPGVDAVILTHAHGDHMGGVPVLLRQQPDVPVYCSKATKLLAMDQANAAGQFIPGDAVQVRDPGETYRILDGTVELRLHRVAHCLGSCAVRLRFDDGLTIVYSGDLGGRGMRTLRQDEPLPLHGADVILLESTLGDRPPIRPIVLDALVREVAAVAAQGGTALFPATSLGRAQELAALLASGIDAGALPDLPVRMTPLARKVLDRYRHGDRDGWLADCLYPDVVDVPGDADAAEIMREPGYVIASGASALGGRSATLAFEAAQREQCGVFFTGYSGPVARQRTRGDRFEIVEGDGRVRATEIRCTWQWTPSPDHPSGDELVRAVSSASRAVPVLLLHGADEAKRQLAERLRADRHQDVRVLADGDRIAVRPCDD